jgi:aarF domain-containing kinase
VPSTRVGRAYEFAGLGVGLALGAITEAGRRALGGGTTNTSAGGSSYLTPANAERLVATLCRVRGAALKLGQMISIQDSGFLPPQLAAIFDRVRESADFMPEKQLTRQIARQLGEDWRGKFAEFDMKPFAAASIGQVRTVRRLVGGFTRVLKPRSHCQLTTQSHSRSPTQLTHVPVIPTSTHPLAQRKVHRAVLHGGREVAVKVQYPGVADSIDSDIENLMTLLRLTGAVPPGLYVDRVLDSARRELALECDYVREAACCTRYGELTAGIEGVHCPEIYPELCGPQVSRTHARTHTHTHTRTLARAHTPTYGCVCTSLFFCYKRAARQPVPTRRCSLPRW